jgi:hypothetical protein
VEVEVSKRDQVCAEDMHVLGTVYCGNDILNTELAVQTGGCCSPAEPLLFRMISKGKVVSQVAVDNR